MATCESSKHMLLCKQMVASVQYVISHLCFCDLVTICYDQVMLSELNLRQDLQCALSLFSSS